MLRRTFPSKSKVTLHTWEPVSYLANSYDWFTSKTLKFLSLVPAPETRILLYLGFQARALTAASCSPRHENNFIFLMSQRSNWLSFPPEAMNLLSGENLRPQISYRWPAKEKTGSQRFYLTSNNLITLSRDPDTNRFSYQWRDPILEWLTNWLEMSLF